MSEQWRKNGIGPNEIEFSERCNLCGNHNAFRSEEGDSLREARCSSCGASVRNSDVARVIVDTFAPKNFALREALPYLKDVSIYESESTGPIHNILINSNNYVFSEYFRDVMLGTTNNQGVRCEDLQNLKFQDNAFDLVITQDVFEHIREPLKAFSEIRRILKPNGYHIFTVPFHEGKNTLKRAVVEDGKDKNIQPPIYHPDALNVDGALVYTDFGEDSIEIIDSIGFETNKIELHKWYQEDEIPYVISDDAYKIYKKFCEENDILKFFKYNSIVLISKKVEDMDNSDKMLEWTGERYLPYADPELVGAEIHYEHLHRYAFARGFAKNKKALDLASGEGYGSFMLSEDAKEVVGVEINKRAVEHASAKYQRENLNFIQGSILDIPIDGENVFDLVVCFEAMEHVEDHRKLLSEIKRLLKSDGVLIISTPNKITYSDIKKYTNPFHINELYFEDFKEILSQYFSNVSTFGQRVYVGSHIWLSDPDASTISNEILVKNNGSGFIFSEDAQKSPLYFIAIASDIKLNKNFNMNSNLVDTSNTAQNLMHIKRSKEMERFQQEVKGLQQEIEELQQEVINRDEWIDGVKRSVIWKTTMCFHGHFIERYLPQDTRRREIYNLGINGGRTIINDGFDAFLKALTFKIRQKIPFELLVRLDQISYKIESISNLSNEKNQVKNLNDFPKIDIIIPVYNHASYLEACIDSAINQTYSNINIIIVDDCSPDPLVKEKLIKYNNFDKIKILLNNENKGISETLNKAIANSSGDYLAFLDCDDMIAPNAIEKAADFIKLNPNKKYVYTNRINVDEKGNIINCINFQSRGTNAREELMKGMYTSHLKVISKDCFLKSGLFNSKYDSAQDYDLALRVSESFEFGYINDYLYKHRVHSNQVSQKDIEKQQNIAELIKKDAIKRRKILAGNISGIISIVILTYNRLDDTIRSIESIYKYTKLPFELIILDNASSDPRMQKYLNNLEKTKNNVKIIYSQSNWGCSGGRKRAISFARGEYIVTLDSDISVTENWLENLLIRIDSDESIAAACAKVVFPDGKIQYNGGEYKIENGFIRFSLVDGNKKATDLTTLIERECDWLPGGALIIKKQFLGKVSHRDEMEGAYEDNDYSLQLKNAGGRLVNCPISEVIHYHLHFSNCALSDKKYMSERYNRERLLNSFISFYKYNSLIIRDDEFLKIIGMSDKNDDEIKDFINKKFDN